jgi:hypothetical protein
MSVLHARTLQGKQYCSLVDANSGPLQYAFQTNLDSYAYWKTMLDFAENFNTFMAGNFNSEEPSQSWMDYCHGSRDSSTGTMEMLVTLCLLILEEVLVMPFKISNGDSFWLPDASLSGARTS